MAGLDELGVAGLCGFGVGHVAGLSGLGVGHVAAGLSGLGRSRGCCSSYLTGTLMRFGYNETAAIIPDPLISIPMISVLP